MSAPPKGIVFEASMKDGFFMSLADKAGNAITRCISSESKMQTTVPTASIKKRYTPRESQTMIRKFY